MAKKSATSGTAMAAINPYAPGKPTLGRSAKALAPFHNPSVGGSKLAKPARPAGFTLGKPARPPALKGKR